MEQYRIEEDFIIRTNEDGSESWIPKKEENSDYQAYLASLDEQQAALEAQKK